VGKRSLVLSSRPGTFAVEDLTRHAQAWSHSGAMTAMVNWYRAFFWYAPKFADPQVHVPTRILWGKKDVFLLAEEAQFAVLRRRQADILPRRHPLAATRGTQAGE
jgi:hypothetical protein